MSLEIFFKTVMTILGCIVFLFFLRGVWKGQIDIKQTCLRIARFFTKEPDFIVKRDPNKIYQNGKEVGIVSGNVTENDSNMTFEELSETETLNRNLPFDYQRNTLRIMRIESVTGMKICTSNTDSKIKKGVLSNVVCEKIK